LILIAVIITASCFTLPAAAQFPKINLPKIPKKDTPATPNNPDRPAGPTSSPSSAASIGKVRGIPIAGAKITYSNSPDGSGPKSSFASSEFIYGRLDLGGRTFYDAFGLKSLGEQKFYSIRYHLKILEAGKEGWEHDWHNSRRYALITKEDAQKTYWNFDVLPDPAKVSTLIGATDESISYFNSPAGIYLETRDEDSARSMFPQNGVYTVDITLFGSAYDDWGKPNGETEKYPTVSARFAFQFSGTDGRTLVANAVKARESVEAAKNKQQMLRAMPSWWSKAATPPEPKLAPARLVPLIKGFIGQWNLTYIKHAVYPHSGPLWVIEKNSLGIPEYRMVSPYIYIIYRDPKDDSCQFGALYMRESYAGAGKYGEPYLGGIREVQHIDCAAVK
jgi:hypothetical protein